MSESEFCQKKMYPQRAKGEKTKKKKEVPPNNFTCWNPKVKIMACINKLQELQNFLNGNALERKEVYTLMPNQVCRFSFCGIALGRVESTMPFHMNSNTQVETVHIRVRYPTDIRASSQSIFGMLSGFTLDPGISDQLTDISSILMSNHLHRNTNSTSKHHLQRVHNASQFPQQVLHIKRTAITSHFQKGKGDQPNWLMKNKNIKRLPSHESLHFYKFDNERIAWKGKRILYSIQ